MEEKLNLNPKEGTLSDSLGIRPEDDIPPALLNAIVTAKIPEGKDSVAVMNPTLTGKNVIEVTALMKKRANFARTARLKWGMGN